MKFKITLFLLLCSVVSHAGFLEGEILFNDGHTEKGYIRSFLEDRFIDFRIFKNLEQDLNLDDKAITFRSTPDGESKTISINDVDELRINYPNGYTEEFKVLNLKKVNAKGEIVDMKTKIWLPYIQKGRINVFGFRIINQRGEEIEMAFYLNNEKENYAINPFSISSVVEMMTFKTRMAGAFSDLFKDCPEFARNTADYIKHKPTKEEKKAAKEKRLQMEKEYEAVPKNIREGDSAVFYETMLEPVDALITKYENECPQ